MGFLVPAFLGALLALALPLWLHLRRRNRRTPVRFPSLQFLQALPIQVTRRRRLSDLPLLLVRALAVAAVVLAFARPVVRPRTGATGAGAARDVVLLVDRSLSMGTPGTWARTLDSARAVLDALGPADRVAVVAFDDAAEVVAPLAPDVAGARAALAALSPRPRGSAAAGAVRAASALLEARPGTARTLVLVSDLQGSALRGVDAVALPPGIAWRAIATGPAAYRNRWVGTLRTRRTRPDGRSLLAVQAQLRTSASPTRVVAREQVAATLLVNGRAAATTTVTVTGSAEAPVAFPPVAVPEEAVLVQVALGPDELPGDDTVRAVVPREVPIPVTLLAAAPAEETAYLVQALALVDAPRVAVERRTQLGAPPVRTGNGDAWAPPVLLAWDLLPPAPTLEAWRAQGAGVVLLAGARVAARRGSGAPWAAALQGLADRTATGGGRLTSWRLEHPLLAPFREVPQALGEPRAWRYPRLEPAAGAEVLARFDDGLPAIVQGGLTGPAGASPPIVVALPLATSAGEWPLHPAFVPLVQQLVHQAAAVASGGEALVTGSRWRVPAAVQDPVLREPGGRLQRPAAAANAEAVVSLADAGSYQLFAGRAAGVPARLLAVNVPEAESQLEAIPPALVRPDSAAAPAPVVPATAAPPDAEGLAQVEQQQRGWRWLLLVAAALLLVETLLATRGRRAVVQDALLRPAPSGAAVRTPPRRE
jgi:hypothetical protein